jgi:hypothetical protein
MEERALALWLKGFGAPASEAKVEISVLDGRDRLKRALLTAGFCFAAALVALPIPIVHFVFVPAALLAGIILGVVRLRQDQIFRTASGRCPFCGTEQSFQVMGRFSLPKKLYCRNCGRELELSEGGKEKA